MPRPKGSRNKATKWREEVLSASNLTPLKYMLQVLNDEKSSEEDKKWAAEKAAPYCHPKLTNIDLRAYAELNAKVEHSQVIDVRNLDPGSRIQLRQLLLQAIQGGEPEEVDGEYEVRED